MDHVFKRAEAVVERIVPFRIKDHRSGEKLGAGQVALAAVERFAVVGQPPAHVEGLAEDDRFVTRHDRLEPHLGRHGINGDGTFEQRVGRCGRVDQRDAVGAVGVGVIALAVTGGGFGVRLDQDAGGGVFLLRIVEHLAERVEISARGADRCVLAGLVDDKDIAGVGQRRVRQESVVFRQV